MNIILSMTFKFIKIECLDNEVLMKKKTFSSMVNNFPLLLEVLEHQSVVHTALAKALSL